MDDSAGIVMDGIRSCGQKTAHRSNGLILIGAVVLRRLFRYPQSAISGLPVVTPSG